MTVRASMIIPLSARLAPNALKMASRPGARAMPRPRPRRAPPRPMSALSNITDQRTWRLEPPIARKSPISRVRCATVTENVLRIMKPPTNNAM